VTSTTPDLTPPPRPVVRRNECGALADRNVPTVHCGAQARPYACGWRCEDHKPGATRPTPHREPPQ
jgi:hypothetical protein